MAFTFNGMGMAQLVRRCIFLPFVLKVTTAAGRPPKWIRRQPKKQRPH